MKVSQLPLPHLEARQLEPLHIVTDDALAQQTGVRVAFSGRAGGVSERPFEGLNLGGHVGDAPACVKKNRSMLLEALGAPTCELVTLNQVHGTKVLCVDAADAATLDAVRAEAQDGADGVIVDADDVAALLCFADCVPVVVVSPSGAFAVVHAGWRGAVAHIAASAVRALAGREAASPKTPFASSAEAARAYNAYIGPYIHVECFETAPEVCERFAQEMGQACVADAHHVDLGKALRIDLMSAGILGERIADADVCTACHPEVFYSYRAEGGTCGRHGAVALRRSVSHGHSTTL